MYPEKAIFFSILVTTSLTELPPELCRTQALHNKYRGGILDATTSSSLILPLIVLSFDEFLPS